MVYTTVFGMPWVGTPNGADAGQTVDATIPFGCVLRVSFDLTKWDDAPTVPFVHSGASASYRIDCVTFTVPVTATLTIT
jgi:hypothetical protein